MSCSKGVNYPCEVQEGRCDFPRNASMEKSLISPGGENLLGFLELWQVPPVLRRGPQEPPLWSSGKASLHVSCEGPLGIPLQLVPGPKSSCVVEAGSSGFLSSDDMDLGVLLEFPQG